MIHLHFSGSSFLVSDKMGYITTFLILVHEIPHEIGDFAILVQSGFTKSNAMNFQVWAHGTGSFSVKPTN